MNGRFRPFLDQIKIQETEIRLGARKLAPVSFCMDN